VIALVEITAVSLLDILMPDSLIEGYRFAEEKDYLKTIYKIVFGLDIALAAMYIIPVAGLLYIQCQNLFLGQTTY
jgi:cyanate permease